jgi:hypothetical protein
MVIKPPTPLFPVPTVTLIDPAVPPVAAPVPIESEPDEPELLVPELNVRRPVTPPSPAFEVRIVIAPLVLAMPCPLVRPMAPPVSLLLSPEVMVINPPTPLLPVPTVMLIAPPLPSVAAPEPSETVPDEPELVVPELKTSKPLTPLWPPFDE